MDAKKGQYSRSELSVPMTVKGLKRKSVVWNKGRHWQGWFNGMKETEEGQEWAEA